MVKKIKFKNQIFSKRELKNHIYEAFTKYGVTRASALADEMKELGFYYATKAGISISIEDLKIPPTKKKLLFEANTEILNSDLAYARGEITSVERFQKVIDTWNKTSETLKNNLVDYFKQTDPLNSIYLMAFSGARGNLSQVRQLVGMRGLMADPNRQIIDIPIIHNFREGLTITDYIMSAYGARKGVVDTALRTADSGYLTRRLIDVAQDVIIREQDCQTKHSLKIYKKEKLEHFFEKLVGRTAAETIYSNTFKSILIKKNEQITEKIASAIINENINSIKVHSPLTCQSSRSICQKCYGWNLSYSKLVNLGEAVGIIAAQSIGEPGTQLTMRTFHTGGIFTADPSRQIRSKTTGFFSFKSKAETKLNRTIYGSKIIKVEREAELTIINYKNETTIIAIPADSSIFIKNKSFIKEGDLIAELPIKNQQTTQAQKNILASHSGEISFSKKQEIVWILEGDVYSLISNCLENKYKQNEKLTLQDSLFQFKLTSKKDGILYFNKNNKTKKIELIKVIKCLQIFDYPIFWDKKLKKLIITLDQNNKYILEKLPTVLAKKTIPFGYSSTSKYRTEMGGQLFYPNKSFFSYNKEIDREIIIKNGKLLFIPAEIHVIKKDKSLLLVTNKTKLATAGTEILNGIFSKTNGFLQTKESNQIIHEIQIKPGDFFEFHNLKEKEINYLKNINKKIFFPGEKIFDDIDINYLSLIEITKTKNNYGILLRPIQEFNIPKPKNSLKIKLGLNNSLKLKTINSLKHKSTGKQTKKLKIDLIESSLWVDNEPNQVGIKTDFALKFIPKINKKQKYIFALMVEEIINIPNFLPKKLTKEKLKLSLFIKNLEYIEQQTILGKISITPKKTCVIKNLKKNDTTQSKTLINIEENYKQYFNEGNSFLPKKNEMIRINDKIGPYLNTKCSGKIIKANAFKLKIHKGTPFFVTPETKLYQKTGNFIKKNELLGIINFEQIVTGDIVQGLPKVEEILEARKPQEPAILSQKSAIVCKIKKSGEIKLLANYPKTQDVISYSISPKRTLKKNDYVYVGQALTEGSVNPHNLLVTYFGYYKNFCDNYNATYLSFKNVQLLLIQKVQQVYNSQGVNIADKHLEIIIRRITSKVQIKGAGESLLLPGEIVDLKQIEYINLILKKSFKKVATYQPILLGITKASLLTDSFISAASFQETTKILTSAAIEGKIDWLRGLKENVIIGRLIPVGSGFRKEK